MLNWIKNFFKNRLILTEYYFENQGFKPAIGFRITEKTTFFLNTKLVGFILCSTTFYYVQAYY